MLRAPMPCSVALMLSLVLILAPMAPSQALARDQRPAMNEILGQLFRKNPAPVSAIQKAITQLDALPRKASKRRLMEHLATLAVLSWQNSSVSAAGPFRTPSLPSVTTDQSTQDLAARMGRGARTTALLLATHIALQKAEKFKPPKTLEELNRESSMQSFPGFCVGMPTPLGFGAMAGAFCGWARLVPADILQHLPASMLEHLTFYGTMTGLITSGMAWVALYAVIDQRAFRANAERIRLQTKPIDESILDILDYFTQEIRRSLGSNALPLLQELQNAAQAALFQEGCKISLTSLVAEDPALPRVRVAEAEDGDEDEDDAGDSDARESLRQ